ncbi:alpha/beta fold hydrolase [Aliiglaciecola sp. LCG003]|uniref:alpha/beta fold hydrolase n=1 Tax=Aliiglaciecola sp. LCG003 TaxID=3053655 RepID=UPI0025723058|nr:alpha/beta fold hydrolase [Aliiglaciecola sp. LCG003]WJG09755.1 alpha/beta fold hydrolase [Aliiglaciecola sp. LCG003]
MNRQTNAPQQPYTEQIKPMFIGLNDNGIFACHHLANNHLAYKGAVVICQPLGHEYERCHRGLKQFASMLAKIGFDVLRFDYRGSGDSAGDFQQGHFALWQQDINRAIDFFKQHLGVQNVALAGLRLGASLLFNAAVERQDINGLCLWSPCLSGAELLQEWQDIQQQHTQTLGYTNSPDKLLEVMGFPISEHFTADLEQLNLTPQKIVDGYHKPICVVTELNQLWQQTDATTSSMTLISAHSSNIWRQQAMQARVPMSLLKSMTQWLEGVAG